MAARPDCDPATDEEGSALRTDDDLTFWELLLDYTECLRAVERPGRWGVRLGCRAREERLQGEPLGPTACGRTPWHRLGDLLALEVVSKDLDGTGGGDEEQRRQGGRRIVAPGSVAQNLCLVGHLLTPGGALPVVKECCRPSQETKRPYTQMTRRAVNPVPIRMAGTLPLQSGASMPA
ncbi:hypothetical protein NDU88_003791 [Pleurodeles waltl]|uniref:Uncharacterized protein n=1 Tax=Pleurodeles waltl TaxID=8319 RepID=A0AAV7VGZ6_PLEWA|nr:hypothetical protein NDU88_003791 [Pleurodeles waltl]